jgi:hypothetical protein
MEDDGDVANDDVPNVAPMEVSKRGSKSATECAV